MRRSHVPAIPNAGTGESGQEVLSEHSELRNLTLGRVDKRGTPRMMLEIAREAF